jgi:putative spermidine/putrescine transport system permease protein/spermidine/putrescine transport system permease protein
MTGLAHRLGTLALGALCTLVFIALYLPIVLVGVLSFFRTRRGRIQWDTFSLEWYGKLLDNRQIIEALANTLIVGFFAVLIALILATLLAFYVNQSQGRPATALQFLIFLPFLLPPIITGLSLLVFFREIDFPRGLIAVTVGHSAFVLALVYRTILVRLQGLSRSLLEASQDLGASRWQTFRYVLLPNLRIALVTAALLAFALSFDETIITLFLIGDSNTLPIRLYAMMRVGFTPEINALVTLILLFSVLLTMIMARFVGGAQDRLGLG